MDEDLCSTARETILSFGTEINVLLLCMLSFHNFYFFFKDSTFFLIHLQVKRDSWRFRRWTNSTLRCKRRLIRTERLRSQFYRKCCVWIQVKFWNITGCNVKMTDGVWRKFVSELDEVEDPLNVWRKKHLSGKHLIINFLVVSSGHLSQHDSPLSFTLFKSITSPPILWTFKLPFTKWTDFSLLCKVCLQRTKSVNKMFCFTAPCTYLTRMCGIFTIWLNVQTLKTLK